MALTGSTAWAVEQDDPLMCGFRSDSPSAHVGCPPHPSHSRRPSPADKPSGVRPALLCSLGGNGFFCLCPQREAPGHDPGQVIPHTGWTLSVR